MREILIAIKEWIIYKFRVEERYDARMEEVEFLKRELIKEREERNHLLNYVLQLREVPKEIESKSNEEVIQPVFKTRYKPWHVKRQELEMEDRLKALKLHDDARMATEGKKTTEQLEREILGGDSA
ncbi:MAG TPA: hypothetical protein VNX68_04735 [Nitrosopumilaceae archaeon]|jgi:hypothetical protein|nr:hypothetical protein [Nitrosopumilaceae archaeon]